MSKKIIVINGCNDCPFRNDYLYSTIGDDPTCNISDDKEIDIILIGNNSNYKPDWCHFNNWDFIEVEVY